MNDKKIIETYKAVRTVERSRPQALPSEAIEDLKRKIDDGLAHANPQNRETRSLAEILFDIENDSSKTQDRKEFERMIAGIADRLKDHLESNQKPLQVESDTKDEPLSLYERRKFLLRS